MTDADLICKLQLPHLDLPAWATDLMVEAATRLASSANEALEEAAKIADGYHQRSLEWAKTVRGLAQYIEETDSSRIAAAIRTLKGKPNDCD